MNSFKEFFKKDLANMLAWRLAKSVEDSLNEIILDKGQNIPIPPVQVKINTTLIGEPIFKNGLLAVPLDGTFSSFNQAAPDVEFAPLPIFIGDLQNSTVQAQVMVSEQMLNSVLYAAHHS